MLYAKGYALDGVAVNIASQLFQHNQSSPSIIYLIRYRFQSKVMQDLSDDTGRIEMETFEYDPRKSNQLTDAKREVNPQIENMLLLNKTALILLENDASHSKQPIHKLMNFNHTILSDTLMYRLLIGDSETFSDPALHQLFPTGCQHMRFNAVKPIVLYALDAFSDICPGQ